MWHPALSTSNKPLQTELYANAALPPPPPMGAPDDISLANLVNLTKLHENELMAKPQTSSTATSHSMAASVGAANASPSTAAAAVAAAAAMYYNASNVLLQNSPLSLMAQLQQYMRNQVRTCPKSPAIPSTPWPATAIAEASNGHLLLAPSELAANGLMATRVTNSTLPLRCEDAIPSELVTSTRSASAPVNNSVIDLMPLDVLADTFIRLNALHLSQQTTTVTQTSLQPAVIQSPASSHSPSRGVGDDSFGSVAAAAAAAMLSMRTSPLPVNAAATAPAPSLAIVPAPPTTIPSPAFVHNNHPLFKPYFYMDSQQQYLNKVTAINALNASSIKTIPSARAASLPAYSDMHNYSSKPSLTGFKNSLSKNSLLRGSLCLPPRTSSKSPAVNCDLKRTLRKRSDHFLHKQKSPKSKSYDTSSLQGHRAEVSGDRELNEGEVDESLLPPPKKKWIRHYLNEDDNTLVSSITTSPCLLVSHTGPSVTLSSHNNNVNNNTTGGSRGTIVAQSEQPLSPQQLEEPEDIEMLVVDELPPQTSSRNPQTQSVSKLSSIDSNGGVLANSADNVSSSTSTSMTRQHLLLSNGVRIVSPATIMGLQQQQHSGNGLGAELPKTISIPLGGKNQIPILSAVPFATVSSVAATQQQALSGGGLASRHKPFTPLTPPPMSSRKFVEPSQYRIRSYSLSSHKISANHQMHVQNSNNGNHNHHSSNVSGSGSSNSNSMMVDDIPPTQQHSGGYATSTSSSISNSQHSPPRQGAGNHFIHMMNAAAASQQGGSAGGNPHVTPRRRTISSTSNGAGTREVHNKLEKNRRAHLKECYEALKNQLSLKDEDRRKTSNLAILGEALKCVQHYQKQKQELEAQWEHLANEKINKQKRIVFLKRELGPKYEQIFSGIFPDIEIGSIPSESDTITDVHSLSSGRGSTLYSSSSSLSSGGSNGSNSNGSSNAMSSPVGAGLQTAMPTAISPVITKINNNNNSNSSTSPISINGNNLMLQQQPQRKHPTTTIATTTIQAVAIPTQVVTGLGGGNTAGTATVTINGGGGGNNSPTAVSSNALVTFGGSTMPLSLTAKNISATAITRGSPTPSTPSPSPSSSSGVSSSSSLISSSPPINGVISNGRNVTVNIPNGLKLQAATVNGVTGTVIGNGATSAAATIIATSAPAQGVNNTNNAAALVNSHFPSQQQISGGRKKTLSLVGSSNNHHHGTDNAMAKNHQHHQHLPQTHHHKQTQNHQQSTEDGEQPAKLLKVFSGSGGIGVLSGMGVSSNPQREGVTATNVTSHAQTITHANNSLLGGSGDNSKLPPTSDKLLTNGFAAASSPFAASELCRLPGGAELNILPASSSTALNGIKIGGPNTNATTTTLATAFYHANGKITFTNNLPAVTSSAAATTTLLPSVSSSSTMPNRTTSTNGILLNGTDTSSVAPPPLLAAPPSGMSTAKLSSLHFPSNFAQLLAAANATSNNQTTTNTNTFVTSSNYGVHVSGPSNITNLTAMESPKSKSTIVGWRTGATTTN
uniref:BHLH domain-containing protein n=1 Tax=Stomoxys calcitrans TaxID=35570 RepID=A0A1I8PD37_STOCA